MAAIQCPSCAKTLNVSDQYAGKKVRCPSCQGVLTVPPLAAAEASEEVTPVASRPRPAAPPQEYDDRPRRPRRDDYDDRPRRPRRDDDYDDRPRRRYEGEWAPCPNCGCRDGTRARWTIWGGLLGPAMINVVRCHDCGSNYNGVHGDYNGGRIAIYIVVSLLISLVILGLVVGGIIMANN
jgi:phage FluMu protein Com